jgi:hypothetical protein
MLLPWMSVIPSYCLLAFSRGSRRDLAILRRSDLVLEEKELRRYRGEMFGAYFDESRAQMLFNGSGKTFADLVALADVHQPLPHLKLAPMLDAHVEAVVAPLNSVNVVGELAGSDPALAPEAVVLSAHLDHLGTGKPDHGNGIFHGAMDDASGIASLLEAAHMFGAANAKPRRSIVFLAVCAEEKGLLGSRYFAAHPSSHAGHLIADINTDMFLPLYPFMLQMSPAPGTPQEAARKQWFSQRYHAQADDLDQPVDLVAAEAYTRLVYQLAARVADEQAKPQWKPSSYFSKYAANPLP